ncbi:MAG: hypothetical protein ABR978_00890 [Dehalococcoidia bacterium]|jgi:hypothetical protein
MMKTIRLPAAGATGAFAVAALSLPLVGTVEVQIWALIAALSLAALASLGYLLRRSLGLVQPPPPEDKPPH